MIVLQAPRLEIYFLDIRILITNTPWMLKYTLMILKASLKRLKIERLDWRIPKIIQKIEQLLITEDSDN